MNNIAKYKGIKIKKNLFFLLMLLCLLFSKSGMAQVYPVQVNTHLVPPYSLKLSDYVTMQSDKLILNLLMTDVNEYNRRIRLRLTIKGNGMSIRSRDIVVGARPIYLDGGMSLRLTNLDLQPYFRLQNLQGISPQQYHRLLPEGRYQFCFEVFDWVTGERLSNTNLGCAPVYLIVNDPPLLNLPRNGDLVEAKIPQNIIFNWTPRHLNATNVQYEFEIREIWDTQIDPRAAFMASPVLYSTSTRNNTLLYGPAKTALLANKTYAWRVRAKVSDGISETAVFRNNGYSEIFYFTYTANCSAPQYILAKSLSSSTEKITWQANMDHKDYRVQYRKKGVPGAAWFSVKAINPHAKIYKLEAGTTYQFRVGGRCANPVANQEPRYTYSAVQEFTTPTAETDAYYNCGINPNVQITNREPLPNLSENAVFTAGDFPVTVTKISGENGVFSGEGVIEIPYLSNIKIPVVFNGIHLNTDYQLVQGTVYTVYDSTWGNVADMDDVVEAVEEGLEVTGLMELGDLVAEMLNLDIAAATKKKIKAMTDAFMEGVKNKDLPKELETLLIDAAEDFEATGLTAKDAQENLHEAQKSGDEEIIEEAQENLDEARENFDQALENLNEANDKREEYLEQFSDIIRKAIIEIYRKYEEMNLDDEYFAQLSNFTVLDVPNNAQTNQTDSEIIVLDVVIMETDYRTEQTRKYDETLRKLGIYYICKLVIDDKEGVYFGQYLKKARTYGSDLFKLMKTELEKGKPEREVVSIIKEKIIKITSKILTNI